jgi:hypothetical protein
LIPGYPATSEFLRSRIAIIARISGYIYPDISTDFSVQSKLSFRTQLSKRGT